MGQKDRLYKHRKIISKSLFAIFGGFGLICLCLFMYRLFFESKMSVAL
jgi:hypothetical protein